MEPGAVTRCSESRGRADCWRYARMASIVPACARFQVTLYPGSECPRIFITLDRLVGGQRGGEINWAETCVTCIVLLDLLLGGTFGLRRWPTPLGPPTDLMPGHLSPARGLTTLNDTHLRDVPGETSPQTTVYRGRSVQVLYDLPEYDLRP